MIAQLQEPTHVNCKVTCSLYQVLYFEPTHSPKRATCHNTCYVAQGDKESRLVSQKAKKIINVGPGQLLPKHLNTWPVSCFKFKTQPIL